MVNGGRILALVLFGLTLNMASGQEKRPYLPEDYPPSTLREVTGIQPEEPGPLDLKFGDFAHCIPVLAKVVAGYRAEMRPMPEPRRKALSQWANAYAGNPDGYISAYRTECLFEENGAEYWIAVHERHVKFLSRDFEKGRKAELCLLRNCGTVASGTAGWILLAEEILPLPDWD